MFSIGLNAHLHTILGGLEIIVYQIRHGWFITTGLHCKWKLSHCTKIFVAYLGGRRNWDWKINLTRLKKVTRGIENRTEKGSEITRSACLTLYKKKRRNSEFGSSLKRYICYNRDFCLRYLNCGASCILAVGVYGSAIW